MKNLIGTVAGFIACFIVSATGQESFETSPPAAETFPAGQGLENSDELLAGRASTAVPSAIAATVLPNLSGGTNATALDINNQRVVVGWATNASGQSLPVVWRNRQPSALPTLGGPNGRAAALNDAGEIVGTSWDQLNHDVATRWRNNLPFDLGALPWGQRRSHALSINSGGDIAGASMTADSQTVSTLHLVRWVGGGPIQDLLPMANYLIAGTYPLPMGINDSGVIAATRGGTSPPNVFPQRAFTWSNVS
jgi:uncharacterized membrane protein